MKINREIRLLTREECFKELEAEVFELWGNNGLEALEEILLEWPEGEIDRPKGVLHELDSRINAETRRAEWEQHLAHFTV